MWGSRQDFPTDSTTAKRGSGASGETAENMAATASIDFMAVIEMLVVKLAPPSGLLPPAEGMTRVIDITSEDGDSNSGSRWGVGGVGGSGSGLTSGVVGGDDGGGVTKKLAGKLVPPPMLSHTLRRHRPL